jgi:hypothetical protein
MRDTRDLTEESVEYAIGSTLCANGVDRKVYHGQCLIGPQIQKLLANRVTILSQLEANYIARTRANFGKGCNNQLGFDRRE